MFTIRHLYSLRIDPGTSHKNPARTRKSIFSDRRLFNTVPQHKIYYGRKKEISHYAARPFLTHRLRAGSTKQGLPVQNYCSKKILLCFQHLYLNRRPELLCSSFYDYYIFWRKDDSYMEIKFIFVQINILSQYGNKKHQII